MSEALYDETSISLFFGIFLHVTNIVLYQRDKNKILIMLYIAKKKKMEEDTSEGILEKKKIIKQRMWYS